MNEAGHSGIQIEDISKRFNGTVALKGLTLSVLPGKIVGIIGPDGAGKTTAMKIICGLLRPDKGSVLVAGLDVLREPSRVKEHVGYMPQRFSLYPDLTVSENLRFYADMFGISGDARKQIEDELMAFSQLERFRRRRADHLSGGMKQKLALSCTLIHRPQVLVLDEPTTGVDVVSRQEFWKIMRALADDGLALLVSTPYMDEAMLCDDIALIRCGAVIGSGTPAEVTALFTRKLLEVEGAPQQEAFRRLRAKKQLGVDVHRFGDRLHVIYDAPDQEREIRKALEGLYVNLKTIDPSIEDTFVDLTVRADGEGQ